MDISVFSPLKHFRPAETLLASLAALSILIIISPQSWFSWTRSLDLHAYPSELTADESTKGNSTIRWVNQDQLAWECQTGTIFPAYCSFEIDLRDENGKGLNLSDFERIWVQIKYQGQSNNVRVMLRNAAPPYYTPEDRKSTKYNMVSIPVERLGEGLYIDKSAFAVANWWLSSMRLGFKDSQPEYNNIIGLELQTGETHFNEQHFFQLEKVVFEGALFPRELIYRGLIFGWSVLILLLLLVRVIKLKISIERGKKEQAELLDLNNILEIQNKEYAEIACTDQLTGLRNRLGIRDALYENMQLWKDTRTPFSLVMMDIDNFKQINDQYGHEVGDNILRSAAILLLNNTRRSDCLARWGGEEFILVCRDTNTAQAQQVAENLRSKLEQSDIHSKIKVTASFGVASMTTYDLDELFKRTDVALYRAKNTGRNRVCVENTFQNPPHNIAV